MTARRLLLVALLAPTACSVVPNPAGADSVDATGGDATDSESSSTGGSTGSTGGSTGSTTASSSSDSSDSSDSSCAPMSEGCPCAPNKSCDPGLTCIDDVCVDEDSCAAGDEDVLVFYNALWEQDPVGPMQFSCEVSGATMAGTTILVFDACDGPLASLTLELRPALSPSIISVLTADISVDPQADGLYLTAKGDSLSLLLVDAPTLAHELVSASPWSILATDSGCSPTMIACGLEQRLGVAVDELQLYDSNAAEFNAGSAWIDVALDSCGSQQFVLAVIEA